MLLHWFVAYSSFFWLEKEVPELQVTREVSAIFQETLLPDCNLHCVRLVLLYHDSVLLVLYLPFIEH